ncbi:hypothetical protein [Candidatus Cardinium sp. cByotN1]|uniref:hypothetical protein n=1 Tax=Candidatus Cardinium sp. cByotN1 TaxID=2699439 RepID=UPI001FB414E6|nr:hypothetical protein [Candidatus Cardinium sp. cByotN1]
MYRTKTYLYIPRLIAVICMGIVSFITTACNRYNRIYSNISTKDTNDLTNPGAIKSNVVLDSPLFAAFKANPGMLFSKLIRQHDYKNLKEILENAASSATMIPGDQIYQMLVQVITSYEHEEKDRPSYVEELLNELFKILRKSSVDIKKVFSKQYDKEKNTIMHLAVDTGNVDIVKCLVEWYAQEGTTNNHSNNNQLDQINICNIQNDLGETPLFRVMKARFNLLLICESHKCKDGACKDFMDEIARGSHESINESKAFHSPIKVKYEYHEDKDKDKDKDECEAHDHALDMIIRREKIILYLLELGVPAFEKIGCKVTYPPNFFISYDDENFIIEMIDAIQKAKKNNQPASEELLSLNQQDKPLLFYGVLCRHYKMVARLCELGACPISFNRVDSNQESIPALFCAVAFRNIKMVECLLKAQCIESGTCNINGKSKDGITIMDVAKSRDGCGICLNLKNYCQEYKAQLDTQIIDRWDWTPKDRIIKLLEQAIHDQSTKKKNGKRKCDDKPCKKQNISYKNSQNLSRPPSRPDTAFSCSSFASTGSPTIGGSINSLCISVDYRKLK